MNDESGSNIKCQLVELYSFIKYEKLNRIKVLTFLSFYFTAKIVLNQVRIIWD